MNSSKKIIGILLLATTIALMVPLGHSAWILTVTVTPSNQTAIPNQTLQFTFSYSPASGTPSTANNLFVQWGDGTTSLWNVNGPYQLSCNPNTNCYTWFGSHIYSSAGTYTVSARVDDAQGNSGLGGAYVTITDPAPVSFGGGGHCCPKPI